MKVIVIEGLDNTGKDTVINSIIKLYDNPKLIHCEKPKSSNWEAAALEQDETFLGYVNSFMDAEEDDVIIFNRAWYGEYVYGCMYRKRTDDSVKNMIDEIEDRINICSKFINNFNICYIQLIADNVDFLIRNDDGLSISEAKKDKIQEEINRFTEIFNYSILINKKLIVVNNGSVFRSHDDIMNDIKSVLV